MRWSARSTNCWRCRRDATLFSFPFKGKAGMGMVLLVEVLRLNTIPTQPSP